MMERQKVIMACHLDDSLGQAISLCGPDRLFILTDDTTRRQCLPVVEHLECMKGAEVITIPSGDKQKSLESVCHVWSELQRLGATRHSMMVNLGGGMVTDLGGFAASTFKRGIHFVNIPTTLLAMVDASVGGKTGFNYGGLKNEIGVFANADCVLLDTTFLRTLDRENILSGYAEMLKHGLISDQAHWAELLKLDPQAIKDPQSLQHLQALLARSVAIKQRIVEEDPTEKGLRKALNLGHTIGHAFEAMSLSRSLSSLHLQPSTLHLQPSTLNPQPSTLHQNPLLHGYAVAYGLACELYLSVVKAGFPTDKMRQTVAYINEHYGRMAISCDDYPALLELMTHDKKNTAGVINFTLLGDIGDIRIDQTATVAEITEALDFYRDGSC